MMYKPSGKKIREARKAKGLTQSQLGALLGVSGSMIGQYETEVRKPSYATAKAVADALDLPFEVLMEEKTTWLMTAEQAAMYEDALHDPVGEKIKEADEELLRIVHELCQVDYYRVRRHTHGGCSVDAQSPEKIHAVSEFILNCSAAIQKIISLQIENKSSEISVNV